MEIKQINEALQAVFNGKAKEIANDEPKNYYNERYQGEDGDRRITIYAFQEYFIKVERETDSYGDNESIVTMSFVTPKTTTVEIYETI